MPGTLFTYGANITGTGSFFQSFDTIAFSPTDLTSPVELSFSTPDAVNLTSQLAGRGVTFHAANGGYNYVVTSTGADHLIGGDGSDQFNGGQGNDLLEGGDGDDLLNGDGGGDEIHGGAGVDTVTYITSLAAVQVNLGTGIGHGGRAEGDTLFEIENLVGSVLGDTLIGNNGANRLEGGDGNDLLNGDGGADVLIGGNGNDTATYETSQAAVQVSLATGLGHGGRAEGDTLSEIENLIGSALGDTLTGNGGNNRLDGAGGADLLIGGAGADTLIGGAGLDTASYAGSGGAVTVNLATGKGSGGEATGDTLSGIEIVIGSAFTDTLIGDAANNRLDGGAGDDTLIGGGGADTLIGGTGIDTASYAGSAAAVTVNLLTGKGLGGDAEGDTFSGVDRIIGSDLGDVLIGNDGNNTLEGGKGADTLTGGKGIDVIIGGEGSDTADYSTSAKGVTIDLNVQTATGGDATGDTISGIENVIGSQAGDLIVASAAANRIDGGGVPYGLGATVSYAASNEAVTIDLQAGTASGGYAAGDVLLRIGGIIGSDFDDTVTTLSGYSGIDLGKGNDTVVVAFAPIGFYGSGSYDGGGDVDTVDFSRTIRALRVDLQAGTMEMAGGHFYSAKNFENVIGSSADDIIRGTTGSNRLDGSAGNDVIYGDDGADALIGGAGVDTVSYYGRAVAVEVDLAAGVGHGGVAEGDTYATIENVLGSFGADHLIGDGANNTIEGDDGADVIDGGGGRDTASYSLSSAGVTVNLATGLGSGGDAAGDTLVRIESLTGSSQADTLIGDAANNRLDGGEGNDTLEGGAGPDALIGGYGNDTASSAGSAAAVSVNLSTGASSGGDAEGDTLSGMDSLSGSVHADIFVGSAGANRLDGGLGSDTLTGLGGADTFVFDTALGATNIDTITDLTVGSDLVELSKSIFSALQSGATPGSLSASSFRLSTQASSSGGLGEIIYNATTGSLSYDADGSGGGAAQQFAQVSSGLTLSASTFRLV